MDFHSPDAPAPPRDRRARSTARAPALALAACALAGCSSAGPADAGLDAPRIAYEMGIAIPAPDGGFATLHPGDRLPMRLGFQGFTFAYVVFTARGDAPTHTPARTTFAVQGLDPIPQYLTSIEFRPGADGVLRTEPLMIFANDVVVEALHDHAFELRVILADGLREARGSITGVIWFDTGCIDDGDAGCLVRDAGTLPSTDASDAIRADAACDGTDC